MFSMVFQMVIVSSFQEEKYLGKIRYIIYVQFKHSFYSTRIKENSLWITKNKPTEYASTGYRIQSMNSRRKNIYLFIVIPVCLNSVLLSLYFSGIKELQQIIAPTIDFLAVRSWREFGLLEQLQNICLLSTFFIFFRAYKTRKPTGEKILFFILSCVFIFLFLEEIDYGIHVYELFQGKYTGVSNTNLHNVQLGKHDLGHFLKQFVDLTTIIWFITLPLLENKIKRPIIKSILPSRYFVVGFLLTFLFSQIAHFLEGNNYSTINGINGNLVGNISEFRELNTYYLYFLYAIQIAKSSFPPLYSK